MSNIIKFPTRPSTREQLEAEQLAEFLKRTGETMKQIETDAETAVDMAQHVTDILAISIEALSRDYGFKMDLDDKMDLSYNDMRVILNMLVAVLYKRAGLAHPFAQDLTNMHGKLEGILNVGDTNYEFDMKMFDDIDFTTISYNPESDIGGYEYDLPTDKEDEDGNVDNYDDDEDDDE